MNESNSPLDTITIDDRSFIRLDDTSDELFYQTPRFVTHIDDPACAALTDYYATHLQNGDRILDLMSSCVSHLPHDLSPRTVIGHGMNAEELRANPQLDDYFIQNLNKNPGLPFERDSFDACLIAVSVQYLTDPVRVFSEIGRVLSLGGRLIVSFSNRMFPTKAAFCWQLATDHQKAKLVCLCFDKSGLHATPEAEQVVAPSGGYDPLYAVRAHRLTKHMVNLLLAY